MDINYGQHNKITDMDTFGFLQEEALLEKDKPERLVYNGASFSEVEAALQILPSKIKAFFPNSVNLKIITEQKDFRSPVHIINLLSTSQYDGYKGYTEMDEANHGNENTHKSSYIVFGEIMEFYRSIVRNSLSLGLNVSPISVDDFLKYVSPTIAHEMGYQLGLVDSIWSPVFIEPDGEQCHNIPGNENYLMDPGDLHDYYDRTTPDPEADWVPVNLNYLKFILPIY